MYNADISAVGGEASARGDYVVHMCTYILSTTYMLSTYMYMCIHMYIHIHIYVCTYAHI